ncbi:unnamed protein product [Didymodactylos carnosus]|uniref:Dynein heavy chain tail domain-containing protein n=1 Tax=Didymodactylos carnosus TaxID=1234261 RepID=A0A813UUT6_9BILA|nr:unnamed protein product [Didymodactylos carnosus]CAF0832789.1 unnamed protein product [Didymodactylos carnosus]CAF3531289.1 unnamed protein product [Didymodactylos carnosus]CAF3619867.1 unnamed protein product [Didymodactylos carnosus]
MTDVFQNEIHNEVPNEEVAPPLINLKTDTIQNRSTDSTVSSPFQNGHTAKSMQNTNAATAFTSSNIPPAKSKVVGGDRAQEMLKQAKALRDERRISLDARHEDLFQRLAEAIGIEASQVEENILFDNQFDCIDDFFLTNGRRVLMFYYQEPKNAEPNQPTYGRLTATGPKRRVIISSETVQLTGVLYYFVRPNQTTAVTPQNIVNEVVFGQLDATNGKMLESIEQLLGSILIPLLQQYEDWGALKNRSNLSVQDFLDAMSQFTASVNGASDNLAHQVKLASGDNDNVLSTLTSPNDYHTMAQNSDFIVECEKLMDKWCKQIEKILAESEQIRREADDVGPSAELIHWKQRMATFNNLLEQVKSSRCRSVVGVLQSSKSKTINRWKDLDTRITDAANEAKDNVRYLYTLDKFFSTLDKNNPVSIRKQ